MQFMCIRVVVRALAGLLLGFAMSSSVPTIVVAQDQTQSEISNPVPADAAGQETVKVGLYMSPPFVMKDGDGYTGMAVEIWEDVALGLNLKSEYVLMPTVREMVDATANGDIDVAVTNLTVTKKRAERIDFTQPWFDAGLRIMVDLDRGTGFWAVVQGLSDAGFLRSYAWLAFVVFISTILLTLFDRRFDKDFPTRWRDGFAESFYAVMSTATSGRTSRKNLFGWVGRIWSAIWLICGVAVLAYVTSTVTSVMTTQALNSQINSIEDLPGKTVGVLTGGTGEEYAAANGIAAASYADIDEAVAALLRHHVDAIIADGPVLEYYAFSNPEDPVAVVGPIFEPDKYGFGIVRGSDLGRPVTLEILDAYEVDEVEALRVKYFGDGS